MSADNPRETATIQIRFLRHLLDRLDTLAGEASPWEGIRRLRTVIAQRLTVITETEPAEPGAADGDGGHGRLALIVVELHRLRRAATAATITTHGGHRHRVRVLAVGHRHTVVHTHGGLGLAAVLVPLRFIESVDPLEPAARH
ncbi:hypothetical protein [Nocardia asiatica]|uniref:hypothetical protein n=1 Tax=Nocardia asiatica TaxID=209252 RepID=UPI0002F6980D|nr:hypothetical protein [Nocardia asiatica]